MPPHFLSAHDPSPHSVFFQAISFMYPLGRLIFHSHFHGVPASTSNVVSLSFPYDSFPERVKFPTSYHFHGVSAYTSNVVSCTLMAFHLFHLMFSESESEGESEIQIYILEQNRDFVLNHFRTKSRFCSKTC